MNIITISREFGSGGREVGKRLADILGYDYYDREIIFEVARIGNFNEKFVEEAEEKGYASGYTLTFGRTFFYPVAVWDNSTRILLAEHAVLEGIAQKGRDCIIVGRCADVVLEKYNPFNIFVHADMDAKVARCKAYIKDGDEVNDKELIKKIKTIDKNRAKHHDVFADVSWGSKEGYHLCVNTTSISPKDISPIVAEYAKSYFLNRKNNK